MNAIVAIHSIGVATRRRRQRKQYNKRSNPLLLLRDYSFKLKYRFNKETIRQIIDLVQNDLRVDTRGAGTSPELQVLVAIRCWGRREVQDDAGDLHGLSQPTVSRICSKVACALARHRSTFIKMPVSVAEQERIMNAFQLLKNFPGVIGAIDCTNIKIRKPGGDQSQYYIDRKGYYSLNVQVVCDADRKIMDIEARWKGSMHDKQIFNESQIKQRFEDGEFKGHLLGGSDYPLLPYLFTPILRPSNIQEEKYNLAHTLTRNTVASCIKVWKERFLCLLYGTPVPIKNGKTIIIALAVIHNIAIDMDDLLDVPTPAFVPQQNVDHCRKNESAISRTQKSQNVLQNFIHQYF